MRGPVSRQRSGSRSCHSRAGSIRWSSTEMNQLNDMNPPMVRPRPAARLIKRTITYHHTHEHPAAIGSRDRSSTVSPWAAPARRSALARPAEDANAVSDSAGEPRGDLLDEPDIAVGIGEGAERPVAGVFGVGAWLPCLDRERRAVPDLAGVDTTAGEFVMGRYDVGDGQPSLGRARRGRS